MSLYGRSCRRCNFARKLRRNEITPQHKVGEVPKAALIAQGQFSLFSAGGIRVVECTTQPTPSIPPVLKRSNKAEHGRIWGD